MKSDAQQFRDDDVQQFPQRLRSRIDFTDPAERAAWAAVEAAAGMARYAMVTGNREEFEAAWERGRLAVQEVRHANTAFEDIPLAELLPVKVCNLIENFLQATTVGDLAGVDFEKFCSVPSLGPQSWTLVSQRLRAAKEAHQNLDQGEQRD